MMHYPPVSQRVLGQSSQQTNKRTAGCVHHLTNEGFHRGPRLHSEGQQHDFKLQHVITILWLDASPATATVFSDAGQGHTQRGRLPRVTSQDREERHARLAVLPTECRKQHKELKMPMTLPSVSCGSDFKQRFGLTRAQQDVNKLAAKKGGSAKGKETATNGGEQSRNNEGTRKKKKHNKRNEGERPLGVMIRKPACFSKKKREHRMEMEQRKNTSMRESKEEASKEDKR